MTSTYRLERPDSMMATITLTAEVKDFKELLALLEKSTIAWPMGQLREAVKGCIIQAEKHFTAYSGQDA